jgi:hypothetical protein
MFMIRALTVLVALLLLVAAVGCSTGVPKGDARFFEAGSKVSISSFFLASNADVLNFPAVDLDSKRQVVLKVRDLSEPFFPSYAAIDVPDGEDRGWETNQRWRSIVLKFTFRSSDGAILHTAVLSMAKDWEGGSESGSSSSRRGAYFRISPWSHFAFGALNPLPKVTDYDLVIDVLEPAQRKSDRLFIRAARPKVKQAQK